MPSASIDEFNESQLSVVEFQCFPGNLTPQLFTQVELNDFVRDLGLRRRKRGSRLGEKPILESRTIIY